MSTARYVTYGNGEGGVVLALVSDYTKAASRRNPDPVETFDGESEAVAEMRRRNRELQQEDRR